MIRLIQKNLGWPLAVFGLGIFSLSAGAGNDLDQDLNSLTGETGQETQKVLASDAADNDDEEINVRELLDESDVEVTEDEGSRGPSSQDRFKSFLPCKIFQSTNSAFVRTLHKSGKVTREYNPAICQGVSGSWEIEGTTLKIKERIRCLIDPDKPGDYGRTWTQKVQFTLDYAKGKPTLNGVWQGQDKVFQLN